MQFESTIIQDVKLITQFHAHDLRGQFVKTFHEKSFFEAGISFTMKESFYSTSKQHVIRGMHFQHPPYQHAKIVFCTQGAILDVALDIRSASPTFGQFVCAELSAENNKALYIPEGFAHGFKSLTENALTFYFVSSENYREADDGILFSSFGMNWDCEEPILSDRDKSFVSFQQFKTPF